jgi:hypothetical protein
MRSLLLRLAKLPIFSSLGLQVQPQLTHYKALKKKMTTIY